MNFDDFVPRSIPPRLPADAWQRPQRVIMDLEDAICEFQLAADEAHSVEHCVNEVFCELLMYLQDNASADEGVAAIGVDFTRLYPEEARQFSLACQAFARHILAQLRCCGLYDSDGFLRYENSKHWLDQVTPVVTRYLGVGPENMGYILPPRPSTRAVRRFRHHDHHPRVDFGANRA